MDASWASWTPLGRLLGGAIALPSASERSPSPTQALRDLEKTKKNVVLSLNFKGLAYVRYTCSWTIVLQLLWPTWTPPGPYLEPLGLLLARTWALLGRTWLLLGASWAELGCSWAPLEPHLEPLGRLLEPTCAPGPNLDALGAS